MHQQRLPKIPGPLIGGLLPALLPLVPLLPAAPAIAQPATSATADPAASDIGGAAVGARSAQGDVSVTIYNGDLALVQDVRQLALPKGVSRIEFPDVSSQIRPETLSFAAPGTAILEQNFDYDLLSPETLMEKSVGQTITLVRTNPATGAETRVSATVLAVNDGVVLRIGDHIEVLRDDNLPARVVFDRLPPNLRARPTLSVRIESDRSGMRPVSIRYLTPGLGWSADYVALYDAAAKTVDVQGWVTLTNNSGTSYDNARTLLVAGDVGGAGSPSRVYRRSPAVARMSVAGTETAPREQLGDYYLYPVAHRTTIASNQTKQVSFLDVQHVPARSGYRFVNGWLGTSAEPESAESVLSFTTANNGGLGDALPAGTVRFYQKDASGAPQFIGESRLDHTPMGSALDLATGRAFDVKVRSVVVERRRIDSSKWRTTMRYELSNAKAEPVSVRLVQQGLDWGRVDTRIVEESQKSERLDAGSALWLVSLPANGRASVTATFETRY